MSSILIGSLLDLGKQAIYKLWPDPVKRAEELRKLKELEQQGDLAELDAHVKLMIAQLDINREQAKHKSLFVAGARPSVIWVGALSLAYQGLVHPLLSWLWSVLQAMGYLPIETPPPPYIDSGVMAGIISGLLGFGGMRSLDKIKRVQTDKIK